MSIAVLVLITLFMLLLIFMFLYSIILYNGLIKVKNNVNKAWSNIDVLLKQRHDELPKLVKVCERYMKHEAETLEKVIRARSLLADAQSMGERSKAEGLLAESLKTLFAVSEKYPELRADRRFGQLQGRITELESEIADRREFFNESVNIYNITIEKLPDVFIARLLNYQPSDLWQINPDDRKDVEIKFSY